MLRALDRERAWIRQTITVIDPGAPAAAGRRSLCSTRSRPTASPPTMLVLAVKPQQLDTVAPALAPALAAAPLLVSILAGVEVATLAARFPARRDRACDAQPAGRDRQGRDGALHAPTPDGRAMRPKRSPRRSVMIEWIADEAHVRCGDGAVRLRPRLRLPLRRRARRRPARRSACPPIRRSASRSRRVEGSALMAAAADVSPCDAGRSRRQPRRHRPARASTSSIADEALVRLLTRRRSLRRPRRNAEMAAAAR